MTAHPGDPLVGFAPATRAWFSGAFAAPTAAQAQAWENITAGHNTLVVAPTGSGKTLAAFLAALDRLAAAPAPPDPLRRCRVLYVSPLKALAVDVQRNLRAPLTGIRQAAYRLGLPEPAVDVAIRSGDTPADERRRMSARPPDILITTPESLFLILTSRARDTLRGVETVIVDEVHAVTGTKRGAHLALSLERLDELTDQPAQRIGLSATVRPTEEVAAFLGGGRDVTVVQPPAAKTVELQVVVPVEDMSALGEPTGEYAGSAAGAEPRASIWPHVEERIVDLIEAHRSTIVFANSRRLAERLCARLNEVAYERRYGAAAEAGELTDELADEFADELADGPAAGQPAPLPPAGVPTAQLMAQAGAARGAPELIARAHHGSVSKEQRGRIEEDLKAGRLPAVVATSSLELGIDMGAVDLVVQVESPPSVASGLQRVGRGGHQVGAVSRGVLFPKYRGDLVQTAVVTERMRTGAIEAVRYPRNPLDVLAQQIVAMVSVEDWAVDDLLVVVRRAAPFAGLPLSAFEAVLDMLAGRYPSDDFAELRPRLVWDRVAGTLTGRPGAQRLAVTSGGTIPDRGLFGVFLVGEKASRVGELDEEMVYESRVGDLFTLGSTTWRIEDITHDRVLVSPAPGRPGRLPFWHGDAPGRPVELGRAMGAFLREVSRLEPDAARERIMRAGLDAWAADNLLAYLAEQREATGHVPDDRTVVVERFRDELGDWRVAVHSPFGAQVHAPWALAVAARLRERHGMDVQAMHSDDGIVLRLPDADDEPPADLASFAPDEIEPLVTAEVGGSALFASRFRECAARALLLPRRNPGRRTPLWQQRQRSAQLLSVASEYGSFPVVLETMRECLQDVFDVPGLVELMRDVEARRIRFVEVETAQPSPFARSLLFGYVAAFMYEGDAPLAERRAQALALDTSLLAELLGQAELRELLDADAVGAVERELQRLTPERRATDVEGVADMLRLLGPLSTAEAVERGATPRWLAELEESRRAIRVRVAGAERWAAIEDAGRLRDALGVPLPVGVPEAFLEPLRDPLGDLVARYARTHGPFTAGQAAERFGLGVAVVTGALHRLAAAGRVSEGEFRPGGTGTEWCDAEVLRKLRRRSLAALRQEVEPSPPVALARLLPVWQQVSPGTAGGPGVRGGLRGVEGVLRVVEQLQGAAVPASALERLVLPARVAGYSPAMLDELCAAGEVIWAGQGSLPGSDGWVSLYLADAAPLLLPPVDDEESLTPLHQAVLDALADGHALFFRTLSDRVGSLDDQALVAALWDLVWGGRLTNDTLAPLRTLIGSGRTTHASRRSAPRGRYARGRPAMPTRTGPPTAAGRWSLLPEREPDQTRRVHALAETLLDRHGLVTRGAVAAERAPGGFAAVYRVLSAFEETGRCRRGYFVEGLGAAQFALPGAVDRMRALQSAAERRSLDDQGAGALVLAATDPANPYGAALPWPERRSPDRAVLDPSGMGRAVHDLSGADRAGRSASSGVRGAGVPTDEFRTGRQDGDEDSPSGHKPGRKAGALVVLVDGELVLYVERGGKSLLTWTDVPAALQPAVDALALAVRDGSLGKLAVERADGAGVLASPLGHALQAAGFHATPRGLRLRG
jgi:ATP-dependent helicase Lhr and Lhr-like helicase